jgi:hypothetical protein
MRHRRLERRCPVAYDAVLAAAKLAAEDLQVLRKVAASKAAEARRASTIDDLVEGMAAAQAAGRPVVK